MPAPSGKGPDVIPAAMQGRWGLTENDCDPARDDNKGLMVVGATTLTFYESRATLGRVTRVAADGIEAEFSFTGEGQNWARRITFTTRDAGMILIRRDMGDGAYPGPYRYMNCEAV